MPSTRFRVTGGTSDPGRGETESVNTFLRAVEGHKRGKQQEKLLDWEGEDRLREEKERSAASEYYKEQFEPFAAEGEQGDIEREAFGQMSPELQEYILEERRVQRRQEDFVKGLQRDLSDIQANPRGERIAEELALQAQQPGADPAVLARQAREAREKLDRIQAVEIEGSLVLAEVEQYIGETPPSQINAKVMVEAQKLRRRLEQNQNPDLPPMTAKELNDMQHNINTAKLDPLLLERIEGDAQLKAIEELMGEMEEDQIRREAGARAEAPVKLESMTQPTASQQAYLDKGASVNGGARVAAPSAEPQPATATPAVDQTELQKSLKAATEKDGSISWLRFGSLKRKKGITGGGAAKRMLKQHVMEIAEQSGGVGSYDGDRAMMQALLDLGFRGKDLAKARDYVAKPD